MGSTDRGTTWAPLSLTDAVDFHALEGAGGTVYGPGLDSTVHTSADAGATWAATGTVPGGRPQAVTARADDLLAATAGGVHRSTDGGTIFTTVS